MIPWQVKLICEFGAQKSSEQPDSSSQPARAVVVLPTKTPHLCAAVPDTPLSLACCGLLGPPHPAGDALVRGVWALLCSVPEQKQFLGGLGELLVWEEKQGKAA